MAKYISPCPETHAIAHARMTHVQNPHLSEKSPMPISLTIVHSHGPNRNFAVATVTVATVMFCFDNSALITLLNETFDVLHQPETLYLGCTNHGCAIQIRAIARSDRGVHVN